MIPLYFDFHNICVVFFLSIFFARLSSSPRPPPIELKAFAMELGMFLTRHHRNRYVQMTSLTT